MATILVNGFDGKSLARTPGALDCPRDGLWGGLSLLGEAENHGARAIRSAMIDGRPAAVVRADGASGGIQGDDGRQSSSTAARPVKSRHEAVP